MVPNQNDYEWWKTDPVFAETLVDDDEELDDDLTDDELRVISVPLPGWKPPWRCATCRWWETPAHRGDALEAGYGWCRLLDEGNVFIKGYNVDASRLPSDGLLLEDDEGWAMYSGPDFGCVHWEAK
jgi:hypothetical protein